MSTVQQTPGAVKPRLPETVRPLSSYFAKDDPQHRCQCGQWCEAVACVPAQGPIHQPYWTVREAVDPATGMGARRWQAVLYDPEADHVYAYTGKWFTSPCQAVSRAVYHQFEGARFPLRLDLAGEWCQTPIDWGAFETQLLVDFYQRGADLYVERDGRREHDKMKREMSLDFVLWHPVMMQGFLDMERANSAALAEADSIWRVSTYETVEVFS